ncbi:RNA polymerase sigma factor [Gracilibacillus saliphilus]|uniref:RNA polymerase sigma factor n=1 Tax=Gracilibacillus saliphilus TaxID=543890 RepID=UPI0013D5E508|nr:sigma-70 family RNA polymerase sigma factor [Gracilibacillus saliphilus]
MKKSLRFSFTDIFIFKPFLKKHQTTVYRFCYLLVNDPSIAEEITGKVFVTIYQKGNIRKIDSFLLYQQLIGCLEEFFLTKRGKIRSRMQAVQGDSSLMNNAVCLLSTEDRIILGLAHVCSLPIEVISSLLDVPKQEVKKSLYQSREFLTDFLNEKRIREQLPLLS